MLLPDSLTAPVYKGEIVGSVIYTVNGDVLNLFPVVAEEDIPEITLRWRLEQVISRWLP
ncbi:MAG: hypothetical protein LIO86_06040 [Lachnospiraceae bacterium]|nr:hypothetical protein [Lachnospiraceae bacterium]